MKTEKLVERVAASRGVELHRELRNKVRTRLAHAGFGTDIGDDEIRVVKDIIVNLLKTPELVKKAGVVKTASFRACPRCGNPCSDVKLADSVPASYCSTCRISMPKVG